MNVGSNSSGKGSDLGNKVAERLAKRLFSGIYKPGDMLPKEIDLVENFSVSRASVRSGLQILTALGIIRRYVGQGTVVEEFCDWNLLDPTVTRWMVEYADPSAGFLRDIFDFRYAIEPYISAIAAVHATAKDLAAIEDAYLRMAEGQAEDEDAQFSQADIDFHSAIYRATHNLVWSQLVHILKPAIMLVIRKSNATAEELGDSLNRHREVMECIRLRQPDKAYDAATRVMERTAFDLGVVLSEADHELLALMKARSLPEKTEPGLTSTDDRKQ